jgi:hypothetical protein
MLNPYRSPLLLRLTRSAVVGLITAFNIPAFLRRCIDYRFKRLTRAPPWDSPDVSQAKYYSLFSAAFF